MEIADRYSLNDTVEMGNSDFESKRAAVIRSAKNDSLVLLNQLRTNVRVQLAHKEVFIFPSCKRKGCKVDGTRTMRKI